MERGTIVALLPDGGWKYLLGRDVSRPTSTRWTTRSRAASTGGERRPPRARRRPSLPATLIARRSSTTPGPEYPNEACGLIIGDGRPPTAVAPSRFEATRNKAASPYRYEIDPDDLYRLTIATDDADEVFWGDRPLAHAHAGRALADGHRAGVLPRRAVHPRVARATTRRIRRPAARAFGPGGSSTARSTRSPSTSSRRDRAAPPSRDRPRPAPRSRSCWGCWPSPRPRSSAGTAGVLDALVTPPPIIRALLVGDRSSSAAGCSSSRYPACPPPARPTCPGLIRAVRLAFLAVAAFAAGAGWALAHPLPLVVAAGHRRHRRHRDLVPACWWSAGATPTSAVRLAPELLVRSARSPFGGCSLVLLTNRRGNE